MEEFVMMMTNHFVAGFAIGGIGLVFCGISQDWIRMIQSGIKG